MTNTCPFKDGDTVRVQAEWLGPEESNAAAGALATVRASWNDHKNKRWRLTLITEKEGTCVQVRVPYGAASGHELEADSIATGQARKLAELHLNGERLPFGETAAMNMLAAAVLVLTDKRSEAA